MAVFFFLFTHFLMSLLIYLLHFDQLFSVLDWALLKLLQVITASFSQLRPHDTDDLGLASVLLWHFLMMASTLLGSPRTNLSGHFLKHFFNSSKVIRLENFSVLFEKLNILYVLKVSPLTVNFPRLLSLIFLHNFIILGTFFRIGSSWLRTILILWWTFLWTHDNSSHFMVVLLML